MSIQNRDSLSDKAYSYILERIITFTYRPNDPIIETDICEVLGISRTPLREALRRLEAEGFVTKVRNKGTFVRTYTQQDIAESCEIRRVFELYALRSCIRSVDPAELRSVKEKLLLLTEDSSQEAYYESDTALHNMIVRHCLNSKIQSFLHSLDVQLEAVQRISAQTPNRLIRSKEEHLAIIEAIEAVDLTRAKELLAAHLENVEQSCVRSFQKMRMEKLG